MVYKAILNDLNPRDAEKESVIKQRHELCLGEFCPLRLGTGDEQRDLPLRAPEPPSLQASKPPSLQASEPPSPSASRDLQLAAPEKLAPSAQLSISPPYLCDLSSHYLALIVGDGNVCSVLRVLGTESAHLEFNNLPVAGYWHQ